jgi:glutamate synthase (NADPH/NADH) small chain
MGDPRGFLEIERVPSPERDPRERVHDYGEIYGLLPEDELRRQGARCMDCGVPFCNDGCPLGNLIPDWNDLVYKGDWRRAIEQLHATNEFPEFTGLICPAPCESACVLAIDDDPVMIKQIEYAIVERAWDEGWIVPRPPQRRTELSIGVAGSGPAGMAAAAELNRAGHTVRVYERDEAPGGLIRFGVPDAKLEKWMIDRRVHLLEREGVTFDCGIDAGEDVEPGRLAERHDGLVVAIGSRVERPLAVPGADLDGVREAMDYLYARNRAVAREAGREAPVLGDEPSAAGKRVVVVGGGDTGMDCVSNALREGAADVLMLDVYPPVPPNGRYESTPWPLPQRRLPTTYALDEGGERRFGAEVIAVEGDDGRVTGVRGRLVEGTSSQNLKPIAGSEFTEPADLVLVAIGFSNPQHEGLVEKLGLELDRDGNVRAPTFACARPGVYAAGDARIGQSLIVNAIAEGRRCARVAHAQLSQGVRLGG